MPRSGERFADDLSAEVLFDDRLVVAAGARTAWVRRRSIDLAELVDAPWILPPPGTWYHAFVTQAFRKRGLVVPHASLVTHSIALRARILTEGTHIATFADSVVRLNTDHYALAVLPVDLSDQPLPAGILTLKNRTLSPIVGPFISIARAVASSFAREALHTPAHS